jgi:hypothetical protein
VSEGSETLKAAGRRFAKVTGWYATDGVEMKSAAAPECRVKERSAEVGEQVVLFDGRSIVKAFVGE